MASSSRLSCGCATGNTRWPTPPSLADQSGALSSLITQSIPPVAAGRNHGQRCDYCRTTNKSSAPRIARSLDSSVGGRSMIGDGRERESVCVCVTTAGSERSCMATRSCHQSRDLCATHHQLLARRDPGSLGARKHGKRSVLPPCKMPAPARLLRAACLVRSNCCVWRYSIEVFLLRDVPRE